MLSTTATATHGVVELLRPYQLAAAQEIAEKRRQCLADQPGLGKTYTVIGACELDGLFDRPSHILILARTTGAVLMWLPKLKELLDESRIKIIDAVTPSMARRSTTVKAWEDTDRPVVVVANHNALEIKPNGKRAIPALFDTTWDAVIIDESHWVLPTEAQNRSEMTQFWRGLSTLKIPTTSLRIAMSGTPDRSGKLENRYGTYKFLLPERYNAGYDYDTWIAEYFHLSYRKIRVPSKYKSGSHYTITQRVANGLRNQPLWEGVEQLMVIRRTKREVAAELPEKQYVDVILDHPAKLKRMYLEFQSEFEAMDNGSAIAADTFATRARQFATCEWVVSLLDDGSTTATPVVGGESEKLAWILNWLGERGHGDADSTDQSRVVITSQYSAALRWLSEELRLRGIDSEIMDGSRSTAQRLAVQQAFQSGTGPRVILLNMSLGDSIDLDAADDMIFLDLVHSPDKTEQVEDRIHRVSRSHQVTIWRLRSEGTIDMVIANENNQRYEDSRATLDGARGVEFARRIIERITE